MRLVHAALMPRLARSKVFRLLIAALLATALILERCAGWEKAPLQPQHRATDILPLRGMRALRCQRHLHQIIPSSTRGYTSKDLRAQSELAPSPPTVILLNGVLKWTTS